MARIGNIPNRGGSYRWKEVGSNLINLPRAARVERGKVILHLHVGWQMLAGRCWLWQMLAGRC